MRHLQLKNAAKDQTRLDTNEITQSTVLVSPKHSTCVTYNYTAVRCQRHASAVRAVHLDTTMIVELFQVHRRSVKTNAALGTTTQQPWRTVCFCCVYVLQQVRVFCLLLPHRLDRQCNVAISVTRGVCPVLRLRRKLNVASRCRYSAL